jgi:hypothetical protein
MRGAPTTANDALVDKRFTHEGIASARLPAADASSAAPTEVRRAVLLATVGNTGERLGAGVAESGSGV